MNGQAALAVLRAESHVSVSAITCYLQCPRAHEHRYILHTPPSHRSGALAFGSAMHTALALLYRRLMEGQPEPSSAELEAAFADAWHRELGSSVPVLLDAAETEDTALDRGVKLVRLFHARAARPHRVVAAEEPFSVELCDPITGVVLDERLVGVFDAVVQEGDSYQVLEHKTGARRWSQDRLAFDLQVSAYALAAPLMGFGQADVCIQLLLKTKEPALELYHPFRAERDLQELLLTVTGVLVAAQARAFYPVRGWHCRGCPYAGPCLAG